MNKPEIQRMMQELARAHKISVAELRREIQDAISSAFENPKPAALAIPRKGTVPTPEEFIEYCFHELLKKGGFEK